MVLNLSPLAAHMNESLCSLRFATKVRAQAPPRRDTLTGICRSITRRSARPGSRSLARADRLACKGTTALFFFPKFESLSATPQCLNSEPFTKWTACTYLWCLVSYLSSFFLFIARRVASLAVPARTPRTWENRSEVRPILFIGRLH